MKSQQRQLSPADALIKLEELCARSEQCSHEVYTRLAKWGITGAIAEKIVRRLTAKRFIDDGRYAEAFVRDKVVYNRWGFVKIRMALRMKKIDPELIDEAIATVDGEEYRNALIETLRAKSRTLPSPLTFEDKQKLLRHAASRGFEPGLTVAMIKQPELWS
ncbi:MAG: RecX family transcriptional regulator [Muribaculaceae bacterium]|nr:RecX family transcriptional regulator [Muribaculaceae bacterium]